MSQELSLLSLVIKDFTMKHILFLLLCCFTLGAKAQESSSEQPELSAAEFITALKPQSGKISLPGGIATIALPEKFHYLTPESAERLLVEGWGNPPGNETLGMIIPTDVNPLADNGWGVIVSYDEDGHVSDDDADEIDYAELLSDMKEQNQETNKARKKEGYGSMLLVGWAESPRYEQTAHKFYWAKEYATENSEDNSLNYNIRVLGRKGVLVLNAVTGMKQIATIKTELPELLSATEFTEGNRYEDYNSTTDHMAEYGLAGLIAGGVATKLGLFAKLFALLIAFKKFLIIGLFAVVGLFAKFFKKS
jgi:uncharacterized membrane-anchored protein